jgi:hypothetical protein
LLLQSLQNLRTGSITGQETRDVWRLDRGTHARRAAALLDCCSLIEELGCTPATKCVQAQCPRGLQARAMECLLAPLLATVSGLCASLLPVSTPQQPACMQSNEQPALA